jgi:hypothetical protein
MVWLSPECRILTAANAMNVARGCTNGRRLGDVRSTMSAEMREFKEDEYVQCCQAIENQMQALEEETDNVWFAMENPSTSDLWNMQSVVERLERKKTWRLVTVDQCAYGRKCKKPTRIMTNIPGWRPKGMTGTGRCKITICGGTKNNEAGPKQGQHEQQMITSDPARKPREGNRVGEGNRREYSVKAGKNLVQAELIQEIVRAAIKDKGHGIRKEPRRAKKESQARSSTEQNMRHNEDGGEGPKKKRGREPNKESATGKKRPRGDTAEAVRTGPTRWGQ